MHYIFCFGRDVKQADESVLPVTKKEGKGKGKWTIGPRMKNECANLCSFWAQPRVKTPTDIKICLYLSSAISLHTTRGVSEKTQIWWVHSCSTTVGDKLLLKFYQPKPKLRSNHIKWINLKKIVENWEYPTSNFALKLLDFFIRNFLSTVTSLYFFQHNLGNGTLSNTSEIKSSFQETH